MAIPAAFLYGWEKIGKKSRKLAELLFTVLVLISIANRFTLNGIRLLMVIFPTGIVLEMYFPTGMKLAKSEVAEETSWYWALNGICGVLGSALAVFISIYAGISVNFYLAALCYSLLMITTAVLHKENTLSE